MFLLKNVNINVSFSAFSFHNLLWRLKGKKIKPEKIISNKIVNNFSKLDKLSFNSYFK